MIKEKQIIQEDLKHRSDILNENIPELEDVEQELNLIQKQMKYGKNKDRLIKIQNKR